MCWCAVKKLLTHSLFWKLGNLALMTSFSNSHTFEVFNVNPLFHFASAQHILQVVNLFVKGCRKALCTYSLSTVPNVPQLMKSFNWAQFAVSFIIAISQPGRRHFQKNFPCSGPGVFLKCVLPGREKQSLQPDQTRQLQDFRISRHIGTAGEKSSLWQ